MTKTTQKKKINKIIKSTTKKNKNSQVIKEKIKITAKINIVQNVTENIFFLNE